MRPARILKQRIEYLVAELPVQLEEIPGPVHREVIEQVPGAVVDGQLEFLEWRDPRWRALKHRQFADTVGDRRHDLHRAGPAADDRDALAVDVEVFGPVRRVERGPGEAVPPIYVGQARSVKDPHGADDGVGGDLIAV